MSSLARPQSLVAAATLGAVSGLRTFTAPAVLAVRGRPVDDPVRRLVLVAAIGELIGDKSPAIPARTIAPALAGRIISGGVAGRTVAGAKGMLAGALAATVAAHLSVRLRAFVGERTGIPDALLGTAEDAMAVSIAVLATRGE